MSSGAGPGQQAADPRKATAAALAAAAAAANRGGAALPPEQQQQQQQQPQDFDSWRHQQHQAAPPGYNLASDLYGFYQQNPFHHYTGFGVGGEGTWSNGDHMTFLGGNPYGTPQLQGTEAQFGMDLAQFGAGAGGFGAFTQAPGYGFDFTGSAAAGYSQWGNAAATRAQQQGHGGDQQQPAPPQWGRGAATAGEQQQQPQQHQYYRPEHYSQEGRSRVAAAEQAMQGLNIGVNNHTQDNIKEPKVDAKDIALKQQHLDSSSASSGGGSGSGSAPSSLAPPPQQSSGGGQPKKMSWASVASQPAKPPATVKPKKPGVLSPPQLPSSKPPTAASAGGPPASGGVEIGTWETATSEQHQNGAANGGPHHPGIPTITSATTFGMGMPPPLFSGGVQQPPVSTMGHHMPPASRGIGANSGIGGPMGRGGAWMGGGRGGGVHHPPASVMSNGFTPHGGMIGGTGIGHPLQHPPPTTNTAPSAAPTAGVAGCNVLSELHKTNSYNPTQFDMNPIAARFFVVKSYSEDDIHRAIKYEIWCSTEHGNKRLDAAFREREGKGPVYLFYSVNGSGHFCGMAQMLSGVDYSQTSKVWAQDKWKGKFSVKWIYVKDVPNQQLRHIKLENNENKPVTNSRDTQEVPHEKGKQVLKILHAFKHATSIFDDFSHYETRQKEEEVRKVPHHQNGRGDRHDSNHYPHPRRDNNQYHRDETQEYRPRGGGGDRGDRRGGDRDYEGGGGRGGEGGGRGRGGGHYERGRGYSNGGRGGAHSNRRISPVQKDGTANGGK